MKKVLAVGLALLPSVVLAQPASSPGPESYRIRLEYRWFSSSIEGLVSKGFAGVDGTEIDVLQDLGLLDERLWELRGAIRIGTHWKLRGGYTSVDYAGDQPAPRRLRFDDTVFNSGERVASTLKGGFYGGDLEFDFVNRPQGFLGLTAGARAPDVDFVIAAPDSGKREQGTFRPVTPVVGLIGRLYIGRVSVEGAAATFVEVSGRKATEAEIAARIHLSDRLAVSGAYRYVAFRAGAEEGGDLADFTAQGWTYGIEIGL